MKKLLIIVLTFFVSNAFGQISIEDSTAQVVSYWNVGEKQNYSISLQKIKLREADTISNELMTYNVDISVIDSTANSYAIEWRYYNYKTNSTNELTKKLTSIGEDIKVIIELDEFGVVEAVRNWEEVRDYMKRSMSQIQEEVKDLLQIDKIFKQIEELYSSKEAIESVAIQDVQQFHSYHGGRYILNEILEFSIKVPNIINPQQPLDSEVTMYLDELNPDDENFIIRSIQEVDSDQLTETTYQYIKQMTETLGVETPKKEEIGKLTNVTTTASRIHETGWLIYSVQTKNVSTSEGTTNIEERIIELN